VAILNLTTLHPKPLSGLFFGSKCDLSVLESAIIPSVAIYFRSNHRLLVLIEL